MQTVSYTYIKPLHISYVFKPSIPISDQRSGFCARPSSEPNIYNMRVWIKLFSDPTRSDPDIRIGSNNKDGKAQTIYSRQDDG